jgi:katanin p80 WD40 repeat-containing subunit B1
MSANTDEEHRLVDFIAHSSVVTCLKLSQGSNRILATGDKEAKINIWGNWDVKKSPTNLWTLTSNKSSIESLIFDDQEQNVVSGAMNGSIKVFDLNVGRLARSLRGHQVNTCSLHYHPYGEFIVSGSGDTTMKVWDVRQKNCIQTYSGHQKELTCVRFSPDGRWVASSAKDGQLLLWDLVAGKLLHSVRLQPTYITTFEFNPMEFMLAAVTSAKTVRIWDLEVMKQIGCTYPDSSLVKALTFSKQDTCLCTASNDSVKLWHWEPVKLTASATVPWDGISDMVMSASNVISSASSVGNVVSLWSLDTDFMLSEGQSRPSKAILPMSSLSRPMKGGSTREDSASKTRQPHEHQQQQPQHKEQRDILLPTHSADPDLAPAAFGKHALKEMIHCSLFM